MKDNFFINEAIEEGINNYLNKTNKNEITTIVINALIIIYGELDIVNPYKTDTESGLGSFEQNIIKFGYSLEDLSYFNQNLMNYYVSKENIPNKYINEVIKNLIDMYILRVKSFNNDFNDEQLFLDNTINNTNIIRYSQDHEEIKKYYSFKKYELLNNIEYIKEEKNNVYKDAYEMIGYSYDNVVNMNIQEINNINKKVYEYFNIDPLAEDKDSLLEKAVLYYKEFPKVEENKSENGYVEFLLLSGFIAVSILVVTVIVGVLMR